MRVSRASPSSFRRVTVRDGVPPDSTLGSPSLGVLTLWGVLSRLDSKEKWTNSPATHLDSVNTPGICVQYLLQ